MSLVRILIVVALLIGGAIISLGGYFYYSVNEEIGHAKSAEFIAVEKGLAPNTILDRLESEGVIKSAFWAKMYLRLFGDPGKIQAGDYKFKSPISIVEVIKELEE